MTKDTLYDARHKRFVLHLVRLHGAGFGALRTHYRAITVIVPIFTVIVPTEYPSYTPPAYIFIS